MGPCCNFFLLDPMRDGQHGLAPLSRTLLAMLVGFVIYEGH